MIQLQRDERGVVSMLAVLLVSILLTIITLSIIRQTLDEQRLATDLSLSTKAFYAAEAGIEDALHTLATTDSLAADSTCSGDTTFIEQDVSAYTCRLVEGGSDTFEGQVPPVDALQLNLTGSQFSRLGLGWFRRNIDEPVGLGNISYYINNPSSKPFNGVPMLRLELIRYPLSGSFNRNAIEQAVLFLRPISSGGTANITPTFSHYTAGATILNANCPDPGAAGAGNYVCNFELRSLNTDSYNYVLRLSAIYNDSFVSFRLQTRDSSSLPVANNLQTVVDVTARANDIYRRVRYRLPNQANGLTPQFAILSDDVICKDPEVDGGTGAVTAGGNDACTLTP